MRRWSALPRPFLATLAGVFALGAILYGSLWMYAVRYPGPLVELGFNQLHNPNYDARKHSLLVDDVIEGSPAKQAGLRAGDRITAVNGRALGTEIGFDDSYVRGHPGDAVALTIERPGEPDPLVLHAVFRAKRWPNRASEGLARSSALQVIGLFPVPFLLVGFAVLFLRLEEPTAWLLALLFCAFIAAPDLVIPSGVSPALVAFVLAFCAIFLGMLGPLFYLFFAVFPTQSPLDRRFPWLKWLALAFGVSIALPGLRAGHPSLPRLAVDAVGTRNADLILSSVLYGLFALGVLSLAQKSFIAAVPQIASDSVGNNCRRLADRSRARSDGLRRISSFFLVRHSADSGVVLVSPVVRLCRSETPGHGHSRAAATQRKVRAGAARLHDSAPDPLARRY